MRLGGVPHMLDKAVPADTSSSCCISGTTQTWTESEFRSVGSSRATPIRPIEPFRDDVSVARLRVAPTQQALVLQKTYGLVTERAVYRDATQPVDAEPFDAAVTPVSCDGERV